MASSSTCIIPTSCAVPASSRSISAWKPSLRRAYRQEQPDHTEGIRHEGEIEWYGCNDKNCTTDPWYVPPRKKRYEHEEVPAPQPYHAVRPRPKDSTSNCLLGSVPYHLIY